MIAQHQKQFKDKHLSLRFIKFSQLYKMRKRSKLNISEMIINVFI